MRKDGLGIGKKEKKTIPNEEFADGGTAKERRIKVDVEMGKVIVTVDGGLVNAHGVRERAFKEVIVAARDAAQNIGEVESLCFGQGGQAVYVLLGQDESLERPDGPEGNDNDKRIVLNDDALLVLEFACSIIAEQTGAVVRCLVLLKRKQFGLRLFRNTFRTPHLAVWMRVRAAHRRALVLENLHMLDMGLTGHGLIARHPLLHHPLYFL